MAGLLRLAVLAGEQAVVEILRAGHLHRTGVEALEGLPLEFLIVLEPLVCDVDAVVVVHEEDVVPLAVDVFHTRVYR